MSNFLSLEESQLFFLFELKQEYVQSVLIELYNK